MSRGATYMDRSDGSLKSDAIYAAGFMDWCYNARSGILLTRALLSRRWASALYGWYYRQPWTRGKIIPLKQIARDLDLSVSTVSSWELGERFPTGRNFEMLANYSGMPPCKLFCVMADKCVPAECLLAMGRKP